MDGLQGEARVEAHVAARQRAVGCVRVEFARAGRKTEARRIYETGGLRLRFPNAGEDCEAVAINTGGGLTGGDRARMEFDVGADARALVATQAAEKIYRADGPATEVRVRLSVAAGGSLVWAPQETLIFDQADLDRRLEADVAGDGSLLIVESATFGRLAHGETRISARFRDQWRVRRDGRLIFAEAVRLGDAGHDLDRPAIGAGGRATGSILWVAPGASEKLEDLRALFEAEMAAGGPRLEARAGVVDGFLIARLLSPAPHRLRAALVEAMKLLRGGAETPRVWRT